jgi:ribosomal protein S18 acetylase RimI-like enzyme
MDDTLRIIDNFPMDRWEEYKQLRLEALKNEPLAFANSFEEASLEPDAYWQDRLKSYTSGKDLILFAQKDRQLVGMIGVDFNTRKKRRHAASLVGLYVNAEHRGQGIARRLMETAMEKALEKPYIIKFDLGVVATNEAAKSLYEKLGFKVVGLWQKELFVDGVYYDEYEMEKLIEERI